MILMKLISPTADLVTVFNSFWTDSPLSTTGKLFEEDDEIDLSKYIGQFKAYGKKDSEIYEEQNLQAFLEKINSVYHARVSGIASIVKKLGEQGINSKQSLTTKIHNGEMNLPIFVAHCKAATGKYTYSFASKVFSFIDAERYPIIDSFVATLLAAYEYDEKIEKSKWGDYAQYIKNYNAFKKHFELSEFSFKEVDKFLWTYAKILLDYWADIGVLSYDPVPFDPKTINGVGV